MATSSPQLNPIDIPVDKFTRLEQEIRSFFDKIIQSVTIKRDELLQQLNAVKLVYLNEEEVRKKQVRELEQLIAHMVKMSIHQNDNIILMDANIAKTKEKLAKIEQPSPPIILFRTKDLQSLLQQLESVATIQNISKLYSDKLEPVKSIGKEGNKRDLNEPRGIRIDEEEKIYVCDYNNGRIQVFSKDGDFLTEFGKGQVIRPHDIAFNDSSWAFVSDWRLGSILKFQKSNFKLVKKSVVDLKSPNGITVDEEEVLVADHDNDRIVVLNLDLKFIGVIGKETLHFPCDVKTHSNKIFAVDMNTLHNVHIFSKSGDLLHSMISVKHDTWGMFMCFDQFSNIIISDCNHKSIQIFTLEGQLIHLINCEGYPTGIAVTNDNTLVCCVSYSVKFF